jgi:hypothetical protein
MSPTSPTSLLSPSPLASAYRELPSLAARLRELPWPAAMALGLCGAVVLLAGARMRRPLAAVGGVVLGCLAAAAAPSWVATNVGVSRSTLAAAAAALLAVGGGLFPPLFLFAAGALPGSLLGASFPIFAIKDSPELGAAAVAAGTGVAALLAARWVAAAAAAILGAALVSAALLAAGGSWPALRLLSARPSITLALAAVLSVAGTAFQVGTAWPPPSSKARKGAKLPPDRAPTVAES